MWKSASSAPTRKPPGAANGQLKGKVFLSAADLLWLFVIGAFLGDHRVLPPDRRGVDEPFHGGLLGAGLAMATVLLRQNQDKSDRYLLLLARCWAAYMNMCAALHRAIVRYRVLGLHKVQSIIFSGALRR